jgi:hypothetical protein
MSKLGCVVFVLGVMVLDVLCVMVLEIHQDVLKPELQHRVADAIAASLRYV